MLTSSNNMPNKPFPINHQLLDEARTTLANRPNLRWLLGGSGSGKTTIARALAEKHNTPIYDMDAHIYGDYHPRFTNARHPTNTAWSTAPHNLAFLLDLTWPQFNAFNQSALPEYLDLLAADLADTDPGEPLLIDGGLTNPALLATVIPPKQILTLTAPHLTSVQIWTEDKDRYAMRGFMDNLPDPQAAWQKFLHFDQHIKDTITQESTQSGITICARTPSHTVEQFSDLAAQALGI